MKIYIVAASFRNHIYFAGVYRMRSTALKDYYGLRRDFSRKDKDFGVACFKVKVVKK